MIPRPEYPRPQFRRKDWTNLNGEWSFAFDDLDAGLANGWQNTDDATLRSNDSPFGRKITVPYCYQSKLSGIGETAFHDVVWYAALSSTRYRETSGYCCTSALWTTARRSG